MGNGILKPKINYSHVLAELSVNSKYPWGAAISCQKCCE